MKRCICWWAFWVLMTSEVTRHLRDISGNVDIHYKNPRTKLLASPKITLYLLKFGRIPDCARIAAWAGLPGSWIHLDAGRFRYSQPMGPRADVEVGAM